MNKMKVTTLLLGLFLITNSHAQSKIKIIPIDKSILKLSEDTTEKIEHNKISTDFDYIIVANRQNNKKDTVLVHRELYIDKKRKPKN